VARQAWTTLQMKPQSLSGVQGFSALRMLQAAHASARATVRKNADAWVLRTSRLLHCY